MVDRPFLDVRPNPAAALRRERIRPADARRRFLPEIQFLRAVSVLAVVVYHVWPERLPGGFIGVDTFFVISGFLITGNMIREVHRSGWLSLPRFYAARARRILPASLTAVLVIGLVSMLVFPPTAWESLSRQMIGSALYVQNWVLAAQSVDYLAADAAASPLQHYWSLAVEEQFYLLWPVLIVLVVIAVRRWSARADAGPPDPRRLDRALVIALGAVTAASLAFSVAYTSPARPDGYYITPTRLWELAAGGLLGILLSHTERFSALRRAMVLAGLALIGVAAYAYSAATVFPGWAALVPVAGAMLIIAAGRTQGPGSITWLVDRRVVQWLGNISYSLYLWHWPLVVWWHALRPQPAAWEGPVVVAVALVLAAMSYRLIEQPFRRPVGRRRWPSLAVAAASSLAVAAVGFLPGAVVAYQASQREAAAAALPAVAGAGATPAPSAPGQATPSPSPTPVIAMGAASIGPQGYQQWATTPHVITPDPATAGNQPRQPAQCIVGAADPGFTECVFGPDDPVLTVALVGDSHAGNWYPALDLIARQRHWRVVTYLHNSCPFSSSTRVMESRGAITCRKPNRAILNRIIERGDVNVVLTAAFIVPYVEDDSGLEPGVAGFVDFWQRLNKAGIKVIALADTPGWTTPPADCVAQHLDDPTPCTRQDTNGPDPLIAATRAYQRVPLIDMNDKIVVDGTCPAVIGNVLVYRDQNHLTVEYSQSLAPYLGERLDAAIGRAGT